MKAFLFLFLFLPALGHAVEPEPWIADIQAQEGRIRRELLHIQSQIYNPVSGDEKRAFLARLRDQRGELHRLGAEIQSMYDRQFWAGAREEWKDVLQQADALQSLNHEILDDLEGQLHRLD